MFYGGISIVGSCNFYDIAIYISLIRGYLILSIFNLYKLVQLIVGIINSCVIRIGQCCKIAVLIISIGNLFTVRKIYRSDFANRIIFIICCSGNVIHRNSVTVCIITPKCLRIFILIIALADHLIEDIVIIMHGGIVGIRNCIQHGIGVIREFLNIAERICSGRHLTKLIVGVSGILAVTVFVGYKITDTVVSIFCNDDICLCYANQTVCKVISIRHFTVFCIGCRQDVSVCIIFK